MFSKGFLLAVLVATPAGALKMMKESAPVREDTDAILKDMMEAPWMLVSAARELEQLTAPTVSLGKCGGKLDEEGKNKGGGDYYGWCPNALHKVITTQKNDVKALSYGIFTFDSWSKKMTNKYGVPAELRDCFTSKERANIKQYKIPYNYMETCLGAKEETTHFKWEGDKKFETIKQHLAGRKPLSTFVKMDIEGSEWDVLPQLLDSPEDLDKIASLDFELHFCALEEFDTMKLMNKLTEKFTVVGRHPSAKVAGIRGACQKKVGKAVPGPCMSVSYVNKKLLEQLKEGEQVTPGAAFMGASDQTWKQ